MTEPFTEKPREKRDYAYDCEKEHHHQWIDHGIRCSLILRIRALEAELAEHESYYAREVTKERDALKALPFRVADLQDELNAANIQNAALKARVAELEAHEHGIWGGGRESGGRADSEPSTRHAREAAANSAAHCCVKTRGGEYWPVQGERDDVRECEG